MILEIIQDLKRRAASADKKEEEKSKSTPKNRAEKEKEEAVREDAAKAKNQLEKLLTEPAKMFANPHGRNRVFNELPLYDYPIYLQEQPQRYQNLLKMLSSNKGNVERVIEQNQEGVTATYEIANPIMKDKVKKWVRQNVALAGEELLDPDLNIKFVIRDALKLGDIAPDLVPAVMKSLVWAIGAGCDFPAINADHMLLTTDYYAAFQRATRTYGQDVSEYLEERYAPFIRMKTEEILEKRIVPELARQIKESLSTREVSPQGLSKLILDDINSSRDNRSLKKEKLNFWNQVLHKLGRQTALKLEPTVMVILLEHDLEHYNNALANDPTYKQTRKNKISFWINMMYEAAHSAVEASDVVLQQTNRALFFSLWSRFNQRFDGTEKRYYLTDKSIDHTDARYQIDRTLRNHLKSCAEMGAKADFQIDKKENLEKKSSDEQVDKPLADLKIKLQARDNLRSIDMIQDKYSLAQAKEKHNPCREEEQKILHDLQRTRIPGNLYRNTAESPLSIALNRCSQADILDGPLAKFIMSEREAQSLRARSGTVAAPAPVNLNFNFASFSFRTSKNNSPTSPASGSAKTQASDSSKSPATSPRTPGGKTS